MGYTNVGLKDKIMEMYPEIEKYGISTSLDFSTEKNAYILNLKRAATNSPHTSKKRMRMNAWMV